MRILIVEDELSLLKSLKKGLQFHSFAVDTAEDGEQGLYLAKVNPYDVIVLDLNLPKIDGIEVCSQLRVAKISTPILMLTARRALDQKVEGLDAGADDYLTKPFELDELLARIRALLRRGHEDKSPMLVVEDLVLDPVTHEVIRSGTSLSIRKKEYMILEYLMRAKGRPVSKEELLEHAWDREAELWGNVVEAQIKNLRKVVDKGFEKALIETVAGVGYRIG